jgi:adenylate cyclase
MIKILTNKWLHIISLIILLSGLVLFSGSNNDLRKRLQYFVFDSYNKIYPREASNEVVIVDLDENSLRLVGQWPWPRHIVADLILKLKEYGAKVVAFDIVFAEEDRTSPIKIINNIPQDQEYEQAISLIQSLPDNDQVFADAIATAGNIVTGFTSAKADETRRIPAQPVPPTFLLKDKKTLVENSYSRSGVATNLEIFTRNVAGNGHFMVEPETDGIIRRVPLFAGYNPERFGARTSTLYPLLSLEALRVSIDPKARMIVRENKDKNAFDLDYQIRLGEYNIPLDQGSKFWMHYRPITENEYVSAHLILNPEKENEVRNKIQNKIVLVGTSAEGLRDIRSTALDQFVPGVEVHVNVVEQIMQGRFLKRPNFIIGAEAIGLAVLGLSIITLAAFMSLVWLGLFTLIFVGLMFSGSWYAYLNLGLLLDPVYPSIALFLLFVSAALLNYWRAESDRRQVKTAFGHYISPVFMEELTKDPDKLKLGGEMRELTVMFTDIRGFTSISEQLSPEDLIQLMNDFLTPMSDLVMESRGTIDKYMGDAMMAFWNAPLDDHDHAKQACLTALKMNEALIPLNNFLREKAEKEEKEPIILSAGIGINTGPCSVGNMGSKQRFAYSALGDAVNLASRLEGQTKYYGVETLIGEDTYRYVKDIAFLELDLVQVKGREKPVRVYTLIGDQEYAQSSEFKKWRAAHNSMIAAYRVADFSCAAKDCKDAAELANGQLEHYYKLYKKRIIQYTKKPPEDGWLGVHIATNK